MTGGQVYGDSYFTLVPGFGRSSQYLSSVRSLRLILNHIWFDRICTWLFAGRKAKNFEHLRAFADICSVFDQKTTDRGTGCDLEISRSHFKKDTPHMLICLDILQPTTCVLFESESNSTVHCKSRCISFVRCQVNWCSSWVASFAAGVKRHQMHRILLPRHLLPGSFEKVIGQRVMLSDVPSWRCKCIQIHTNAACKGGLLFMP